MNDKYKCAFWFARVKANPSVHNRSMLSKAKARRSAARWKA